MTKLREKLEKKIRDSYTGIISEEQILATIKWWDELIEPLQAELREVINSKEVYRREIDRLKREVDEKDAKIAEYHDAYEGKKHRLQEAMEIIRLSSDESVNFEDDPNSAGYWICQDCGATQTGVWMMGNLQPRKQFVHLDSCYHLKAKQFLDNNK